MPDVGRRRILRCLVVSWACLGVAGCGSGGSHRTRSVALPTPSVTARGASAPRMAGPGPSTPTVAGPIPSTPSNFPFIADGFGPEPPVPAGYEENEYFVSGRAKLYEYTATGVRPIA